MPALRAAAAVNTAINNAFIKRPFFPAAVAYVCGVFFAGVFACLPLVCFIAAAVLCALCALLVAFKRRLLFLLLAAFFALGAGLYTTSTARDLSAIPEDTLVTVCGEVTEASHGPEYTTYTLRNATINNAARVEGAFLRSKTASYEYGDIVASDAYVYLPRHARYKNGFDDKNYCDSKNVAVRAYSQSDAATGTAPWSLMAFFNDAAKAVSENIDYAFAEQAGLAKALFMGETDDINEDTLEAFRATGIAHLLATSGLHVGFILAALHFLLKRLPVHKLVYTVLIIAILIFYAGLAGFRISIVRAVIMASFYELGTALGRRRDGLNALCAALLFVTLINPAQVYDVGLQLSFSAVFAILCIAEPIARVMRRLPRYIAGSVSVSLAATAGTAPVLINTFHKFPLISVLLNLIVIPMAAVVTIGTALCVFVSLISPVAAYYVAIPFRYAIGALEWTGGAAAALPLASIALPSAGALFVLTVLLCCYCLSRFSALRSSVRAAVACVLITVWTATALVSSYAVADSQLKWLDREQTTLVSTRNAAKLLIDTGPYETDASNYLKNNGITLNAVLVTGIQKENVGGLFTLLTEEQTPIIYAPAQQMFAVRDTLASEQYGVPVLGVVAGDRIALDAETSVEILSFENEKLNYRIVRS